MTLSPHQSPHENAAPESARNPVAEPASPLDESHFQFLRHVTEQRRPIRNAARTARGSAITILVVGAASVPLLLLSPSWRALFVVAGIWVIGVREYIGSQRMRQCLPSAATFLGRNQLAFIALIVVYCTLQMLSFSGARARDAMISPELQSQLAMLPGLQDDIHRQIELWAPLEHYGFYSLVIVLSMAVQGSLASYYFTRKRHLETLAQHTPAWIQRLFTELDA